MNVIESTQIQNVDQWNAGNGQPIRETLLRLAVKYCENYATDIVIFFGYMPNRLERDFSIEIGFRQYGVDWPSCSIVKYRYVARLTKCGSTMTLEGEVGEV